MTRNSEHAVQEKSVTRSEADEIARAIATAAADQILARAADADALGLPFTGSLELEVKYGGYTYLLVVEPPAQGGTKWLIELSRKNDDQPDDQYKPIVKFEYLNPENWETLIGLPQPITLGAFTIAKLDLTVGRGAIVPSDISSLVPSSAKRAGASAR